MLLTAVSVSADSVSVDSVSADSMLNVRIFKISIITDITPIFIYFDN